MAFLESLWAARGSPNTLAVWGEGERGWLADTETKNFQAARRFCSNPVVSVYSLITLSLSCLCCLVLSFEHFPR